MRSLEGREMTAEQVAAKLARDRAPMDQAFEVARAIVDDVQHRGDAVFGGPSGQSLRLTIGTEAQDDALLDALKEVA